ncbi:hypothetical protein WOLCODRAFT_136570 [Wolfiporia cocos MD-104 SS10]|uniref:SET domain-containing protein n=1 Tax=Wolfiporia cocos (strain MD-104) TaxID=742152 RepID=A0A2H3JEF8_WOLCO|nr:hypothetical protein WOLCODRAFT_136570 [Wolfiporia cocos MD-104 SS10]
MHPANFAAQISGEAEQEAQAPEHLNSTGCRIAISKGKGRGVFASRVIEAHTVIEISPVLLFSSQEYEEHGRHTVLDHYTFKWRDGRMALALGLGSLFNHSQTPNVSYTLDVGTESIRYTATRRIDKDEELCIFYGHNLWFDPIDAAPSTASEEPDDGWGGLSILGNETNILEEQMRSFKGGNPDDVISEDDLPFTRIRLTSDDEEDEIHAVRTEHAWVVDIPDARQTTVMLRWLKQSGLETPSMAHLKRIRRQGDKMTILLAYTRDCLDLPTLPPDVDLPQPYVIAVPCSAALTLMSLAHKNTYWPTVYAPRRKNETEEWSRGKVMWAYEAMIRVMKAAQQAQQMGELPTATYVPIPYDEGTRIATQLTEPIFAHDTRQSQAHPLRHAILNVVRTIADLRASPKNTENSAVSATTSSETQAVAAPSSLPIPIENDADANDVSPRNGAHYLLTSLTLFVTHEPCVMCSMALLHSRVKEIFYLVPMNSTGGCGGVACVPKLHGVNHRFGIGRWKDGERIAREYGIGLDSAMDV